MRQTCNCVVAVFLGAMIFGTASVADEPEAGAGGTSSRADSNKEKQFSPDQEVVEPAQADSDEPFAKEFSLKQAADYLDAAALHWTRTQECATCHTNVPHLLARPVLSKLYPPTGEVRAAFEHWSDNWDDLAKGKTPISAVTRASSLTINDMMTTGTLHPSTLNALDRMWQLQRNDGGWDWRLNNAPPMKSDEHYGVTFAAVALGKVSGDYVRTPQAQKGIEGIRKYLTTHSPHSLHHRAMVAWASLGIQGLMSASERQEVIENMLDLQRADGGWSAPSLFGDWKGWELDDEELESDGYGTGFVVYLARLIGITTTDARIQRGIQWIKNNQRESGRWFTASIGSKNPYDGNRISTAGTAMVLLALDACGEIQQH